MWKHASSNRRYRLVWSAVRGALVPAPESAGQGSMGAASGAGETVAAGGGASRSPSLRRARLSWSSACVGSVLGVLAAPTYAIDPGALPQGADVAAGQAAITPQGSTLVVTQDTDRAIINWQSFDVGRDAAVQFEQPDAAAVTLNRVVGGGVSQIEGSIGANGQVYVVNSAGVVFGAGAQVDVGGLVASTLSITDADFMAGQDRFTDEGGAGQVINAGRITTREGGRVVLLGSEVSNTGEIHAPGGDVALAAGQQVTFAAGANGHLQIAVDAAEVATLVTNGGLIQADGGQVVMTARGADALASAVVRNTGTVQAQTLAEREGRILLLADLDAGGVTEVAGTLDASAPVTGNGGFIETSAAGVVIQPEATITTRAEQGRTGTWLIDPDDFTITAGPTSAPNTMAAAELSSRLASNSMWIYTTHETVTPGKGDIHVDGAVTWNSNNTLTLDAYGDININAPITANGGSARLEMVYGRDTNTAPVTTPRAGTDYHVRAPITLSGSSASLEINGQAYQLIHDLETLKSLPSSGRYALAQDIDGTNSTQTRSLLGHDAPFTGTLIGLGHKISNLRISQLAATPTPTGLVGRGSGATLRDLSFVNLRVDSQLNVVGGLAGELDNASTVSNVHVQGRITAPHSTGVGGLVGRLLGGSQIDSSSANARVQGSDSVGGLVGEQSQGTIRDVYIAGTVLGTQYLGGVVGRSNGLQLSNALSLVSVGPGFGRGGLLGREDGQTNLNHSRWLISHSDTLGAAVGVHAPGSSTQGDTIGDAQDLLASGGLPTNWSASRWSTAAGVYPYLRAAFPNGAQAISGQATLDGNVAAGGQIDVMSGGQWLGSGSVGSNGSYYLAVPSGSLGAGQSYLAWLSPVSGVRTAYYGEISGAQTSMRWVSNGLSAVTDAVNYTTFNNRLQNTYLGRQDIFMELFALNNYQLQTTGSFILDQTLVRTTGSVGLTVAGTLTMDGGQIQAPNIVVSAQRLWNEFGAFALSPNAGGGRWVVYLDSPDGNTYGGLNSGQTAYWGATRDTAPESLFSTNQYVFAQARTLTVQGDASTTTYGSAPVLGYSITGQHLGQPGVFLPDGPGVTGHASLSVSGGGADWSRLPADSYTVTLLPGTLQAPRGHTLAYHSGSLTVNRRLLNASAIVSARDYDRTDTATVVGLSWDGLLPDDDVRLATVDARFDSPDAGQNKPVTLSGTLSGADASNYTLAWAPATATIAQRVMTVTLGAVDRVYDGTTAAVIRAVSRSNYFATDDVDLAALAGSFDSKDVGQNKLVTVQGTPALTGADAHNYSLSVVGSGSLRAAITPYALTVQPVAVNRAYDGTNQVAVTFAGGLGQFGDDDLSVTNLSGTMTSADAGLGKPVAFSGTLGGADAGNYVLNWSATPATVDIARRQLTPVITGVSRAYDGTTNATVQVNPLADVVNNDLLWVTLHQVAFADKNAGTGKPVQLVATLSGQQSHNYSVDWSQLDIRADITPLSLTALATAASRIYDGSTQAAVTLSGLQGVLGNDDVNVGTASGQFASKDVGTGKPVAVTGTLTGADAQNYILAPNLSATADITPLSLTAMVTAASRAYDGTTRADVSLINGGGPLANDDVTLTGVTGQFASKDVGSAKPVQVSGTLSGADAHNYLLDWSQVAVTADITPRQLLAQVSAASREYDGTTRADVTLAGLSGQIAGDNLAVSGLTGAFAERHAGTGRAVTVSGQLAGADAHNYVVDWSQSGTQADITPRLLGGTVVADNKVYDGTTTAVLRGTLDASRVIAGDAVALAATGAFRDRHAGVAKPVDMTSVLCGADAGNYRLADSATPVVASITPRQLLAHAQADNKVYDGTTAATASGTLAGVVAGDAVALGPLQASFTAAGVGRERDVQVAGDLQGADAGNYLLAWSSEPVRADITPRTLVVTANDAQAQAGATPYAGGAGVTYDGFVEGEDERVLDGELVYGGSAQGANEAGTYQIQASGLQAANYALVYQDGTLVLEAAAPSLPVLAMPTSGTITRSVSDAIALADARRQGILVPQPPQVTPALPSQPLPGLPLELAPSFIR